MDPKTLQAVIDAAYDALSEAFLIVDTVEFNTAVDEVRGMLAAYRS